MALAGIRSLQSFGASALVRGVLNQQLGPLPDLPTGYHYASAYVRPTVDANFNTTNLAETVAGGVAQGLKVVKEPPKPSLFQELKFLGSFFGGFIAAPFTGGTSLIGSASALASEALRNKPGGDIVSTLNPRGSTMGLFDDIWGGVQSASQGIFSSNSGFDWSNLLNSGVSIATNALAPRTSVQTSMAPAMSAAGAVARVGGTVGRGFFNRFPNLATAIQGLRNQGRNVTRAKLYGVLKRFGPEFLVTGGLMTAAAVNELAVAGPGYRRMNPANVRALRRSVRRIESFHRLCKTTDSLHAKRRRK